MANAVILPGNRLAGLQVDLLQKLRSGSRTLDELDLFLQGENPFAFERNEYGHIVLTVTGLDLTGSQDIEHGESNDFRFGEYAKQCLTSTRTDGYDAVHRLAAGQTYKIAFMPTKEIKINLVRTTANLRKRGMEKYGYDKPLAGIVPRYRERISDKQMGEMGFRYIFAPHDTINDDNGGPCVLGASRSGSGSWVDTGWDEPDFQWEGDGAFAFYVPAK